jgi:gamma-glutamyltranspeptidase/glutathione hydrolase
MPKADLCALRNMFLCVAGAFTLAACEPAALRPASPAPAATWTAGVAAANPHAVEAGLEILRSGGSAVDAAVAVQAMLGLVEPQSSGLGGGAFLMYYDAATGQVTAFDGREAAPTGATPDMFLNPDGERIKFFDAVTSGRSTGVPGAVAMLGAAHEQFGKKPWRELFGPAIRAAEEGFTVPGRLGRFANSNYPQAKLPDAQALFTHPDG